ncbi:MAG: ribosome assembly factor SBDS [Candidatus Woesearchaeota archaeon]|nr:ribosome assembly factor SBDS [Candidatus Woesearchaeota archaeon]
MSTKGRQTMDHERVHFNLARLNKGGKRFEVAIEPDLAIQFKKGSDVAVHDVIRSEHIFADVKKGLRAEETAMKTLFNTTDVLEIAKKILTEGELQLTEDYRNSLRAEKHQKVIELICRNAIDPKSNLPHPPQRIENALHDAKVRIDEFKTAEEQLDAVVEKLKPLIPIRIAVKQIEITVPNPHAPKAHGIIAPFAKPQRESWGNNGSYTCIVEIPAGLELQLYDKLNSFTRGSVQTKVLKQ